MIELSPRHWVVLTVLALAAALPSWLHVGGAMHRDDCANPAQLRLTSRIPGTSEGVEDEKKHEMGIFQWTNGTLHSDVPVDRAPKFRIVRSFEPAEFYFEPKRFLVGNPFPSDVVTPRTLRVGPDELPYFTRYDTSEGRAVVTSYLYVFDGRPIRNLFAASFDQAGAQLAEGTRPVTLFVTDRVGELGQEARMIASSEAWLADAWRYYASVCIGHGG